MFQMGLSPADRMNLAMRLSELTLTLNSLASEGAFASPDVVTSTRLEFGLIQVRLRNIPEELEHFLEIPVAELRLDERAVGQNAAGPTRIVPRNRVDPHSIHTSKQTCRVASRQVTDL
jgi:hypothetical protein